MFPALFANSLKCQFDPRPFSSSSGIGSASGDPISHVLTPTDQIEDPIVLLEGRRSSTGALLSPDVLDQIRNESGEGATSNDNFYMLKKDSQRRLTLVKVLQQDKGSICRQWLALMTKEVPEHSLNQVGENIFIFCIELI